MSLLDDLQSQLADKRDKELALREERQTQEEFYAQKLRPVMVQAKEYFEEIVKNIKELGRHIECEYPLNPDSNAGVHFLQSDYEFFYDEARNPRSIEVICYCKLKYAAEFFVSTKVDVEKYAELLTSYGITFHQKNRLDDFYNIRAATFYLDEAVSAAITIQSHPADRCVYIYLKNFADEPLKKYRFAPEKLTPDLFEKIARILLREETELVKIPVSEHFRENLKEQVHLERLEKDRHIAEGLAYLETVRLEEEESKLINRVKNTLSTRHKDIAAVFSTLKKDFWKNK